MHTHKWWPLSIANAYCTHRQLSEKNALLFRVSKEGMQHEPAATTTPQSTSCAALPLVKLSPHQTIYNTLVSAISKTLVNTQKLTAKLCAAGVATSAAGQLMPLVTTALFLTSEINLQSAAASRSCCDLQLGCQLHHIVHHFSAIQKQNDQNCKPRFQAHADDFMLWCTSQSTVA